MPIDFVTLPDELQTLANDLFEELTRRGYRPKIEPQLLELPATPTILGIRGHETHYFLVRQTVSAIEVQQWHRYCCSCTADTRLTICRPSGLQMLASQAAGLRSAGIGLASLASAGLQYESDARDLAFHAQAPDRTLLKPKVRQLLGEALDRLDRGDWRPAFEDACGVLEEECRAYLLKNLKMGRVKYQSGRKIKIPTAGQIKKMPMGALKDIFCTLISQNQLEAHLCSALTKLNPDRIRRAHKRKSKGAETALRRRAGPHFWLINNALSLLV
jgi:hypothetical protein